MTRLATLLCLLLGALLFAASAHATAITPAGGAILDYVTGGVNVYDGKGSATFYGRTWSAAATGGGIQAAEKYGASIAGRSLIFTAARTIALGGLASDIMALRTAWNVGQAIGSEINNYLGDSRVAPGPDSWMQDAGQPPATTGDQPGYSCSFGDFSGVGTSPLAACNVAGARYASAFPGWSMSFDTCDAQLVCRGNYTDPQGNTSRNGAQARAGATVPGSSQCPAVIDALNPAYSQPAGGAPGIDGKCRTGRYSAVSDAAAAQAVRANQDLWGNGQTVGQEIARHVVEDMGQPLDGFSPMQVSGPSSIAGSPTSSTTSNPDGTTSTTTTTPTTTITYEGNHISYNTSSVTNTCAGSGSCSTTTTTAPGTGSDAPTQCDTYPDTLGCAKMGDPPTDTPDSKTTDVSYQTEDLGVGGGCPPPWSFTVPSRGWVLSMSYQPACDVAPLVAPGVLALCSIAALGIVVAAIRS